MDKHCSQPGCNEKVFFVCSCSHYYCEVHLGRHSRTQISHESFRLFRVVDRRIKQDALSQAYAKIQAIQDLKQKALCAVETALQAIQSTFISWKEAIDRDEEYLYLVVKGLQDFDMVLIDENQKIIENIGSVYKITNSKQIDLSGELLKYLNSFKILPLSIKQLNSSCEIKEKILALEGNGLFIEGITKAVTSIALSVNEKWLITGSIDKTVRVLDSENSTQVSLFRGHTDRVLCVAISADSKLIASGSRDSTIIIWNMDQKLQESVLRGHQSDVLSLAFDKSMIFLVSASADKSICIWNINQRELITVLNGHGEAVNSALFTHNLKHIISCSDDKKIFIWSIFQSHNKTEQLSAHKKPVKCIALTSDENFLISGSLDKKLIIWNLLTKKPERTIECPDEITCLALAEHSVVCGCKDKVVYIWEWRTGVLTSKLRKHNGNILSVGVKKHLDKVFSGSEEDNFSIFSGPYFEGNGKFPTHTQMIDCLATMKCGKYVVSGSLDKTVRIWNLEKNCQEWVFEGHTDFVKAVAITSDAKYAISGSLDNTVKVWDIEEKRLLRELKGHTSLVFVIVISNDQIYVFTGSNDRTIVVWKISDFTKEAIIKTRADLLEWSERYRELEASNIGRVLG